MSGSGSVVATLISRHIIKRQRQPREEDEELLAPLSYEDDPPQYKMREYNHRDGHCKKTKKWVCTPS
jgi:hypothetical protein